MGQGVLYGLLLVLQPESLLYLTIGMAIGLVIGFLPGLGGLATLALLTPLIIGMEPAPGLAFILGAYGAVSFGGSITACHGATRAGDAELVPQEMGSAWPVVKAIKKALDPNNVMNPGKQSLDEAYE